MPGAANIRPLTWTRSCRPDSRTFSAARILSGLVMEGGSIDVNGAGSLLTTTSCLLNPNRNPGKSKTEIEQALARLSGRHEYPVAG